MSSIGSNSVAFWAVRGAGTSSDEVATEITVVLRRVRFRDMTHVDMKAGGAGRRILGPGNSDERW
jgi:hypothetical protein